MLKILIVEDEVFVRKGIRNIIENQSNHIVSAEAGNGLDAINYLKSNNVDLVLTDLSMPVMDGIDLIREIKNLNLKCKIIILSCLSDSEYTIKAIKYGANDYFLKVETDPEDIIARLNELDKEISEEKAYENTHLTMENELKYHKDAIISKFLSDIFFGPEIEEKYVIKRCTELGLQLSGKNIHVVLMIISGINSIEQDLLEKEKQTINFSVLNIVNEVLKNNNNGVCFSYRFGHYIIIRQMNNNDNPAICFNKEIGDKIFEPVKKIFNIDFLLGFGNCYNQITKMKISYNEAKSELIPIRGLTIPGHIENMKKYVLENLDKNITLSTIAEKFNFNPCYISIMFKENLGENFIDYLTRLRIDKAKELIMETDIPAFEIGYKVGYQSPQYFSKIFAKIVGMSVTEYKKSICKKAINKYNV